MLQSGSTLYIYDAVDGNWVPWTGTAFAHGGVVLYATDGTALWTPHPNLADVSPNDVRTLGTNNVPYQLSNSNGTLRPQRTLPDDLDIASPNSHGLVAQASVLYGYSLALDDFQRVRTIATNADAATATTVGILGTTSFTFGYNGTNWDRLRTFACNADDVTSPTVGVLGTAAFNFLYDGTNFDRARALVDSADAVATGTVGLAGVVSRLTLYNGATYDRARTGSAANLSASNAPAPLLATPPGEWAINHTPTSNTQATITRAAGATGVRHVCKSITATIVGLSTAAADTTILVNLRDGATGAGTILWSTRLLVKVGDTQGIALTNLNIPGSAATAMTLEFSAAGGANTFESVALSGFDAI